MMFQLRRGIYIALFFSLPSLSASAQPPQYNLTPLISPSGYGTSQPSAINDNGQVVGLVATPEGTAHAFFWENGVMQDLGTLGGDESWATSINNAGQVVGRAYNSQGARRAFLWENGSMQDLGTLYGNSSSWAQGINDSGQIVGWTWDGSYPIVYNGFLWENGSMHDIGTLDGEDTYARAINNAGQIVGSSGQAYLWQNNTMQQIGFGTWSSAVAINNSSQIVIRGNFGTQEQAFLWQNYSMQLLPLLPDFNFTIPYSINDSGQIVGTSYSYQTTPEIYRAFIYQDGLIYNLNDYLAEPFSGSWLLRDAYGINNQGQIVAYGYGPSGAGSVLLTPVPEPATLLLFALGGLALRRRH